MALAALHAQAQARAEGRPDPLLLFCPADHHIPDTQGFVDTVQHGVAAAQSGAIVTFGVVPSFPSTAYGYIEQGPQRPDGSHTASRFIEKNDDSLFWTLKVLQENTGVKQRTLAKEVGINVSIINFCLKALVEKGWIKMDNFSKNPDRLSYAYLLTSTGVSETAALTRRFLQRKMNKYENLRGKIEVLQLESTDQNCKV